MMLQWLKQPLTSIHDIEKRHNIVEALCEDSELRQTIQEEHLKKVPDLNRLAKRFQRKKGNLQDVVRLYQVVIRLPGLVSSLGKYEGDHKGLIHTLFIAKIQV